MKDLILVVSNAKDETVGLVTRHLAEIKETFYWFETERFPSRNTLALALTQTGLSLRIEDGGAEADLMRVKSVWYRRPGTPKADDSLPKEYREFAIKETEAALRTLYSLIKAFWLYHPLNAPPLTNNKLHQLKTAREVGLEAPETIITNSPPEAMSFAIANDWRIVIKTISGHYFARGREPADDPETFGIYTNPVPERALREYLTDIRLTPVFLQRYVPKKVELRITVVGARIFTCAIHSQDSERTKHDWRRYDFANVRHEPYQLPQDIEAKLLRLMKRWELSFGAIDMILTPDDRYVFLEINPNGQWGWIEGITGMPISRAIAELLAHPSPP